jgi:hypothetical protein
MTTDLQYLLRTYVANDVDSTRVFVFIQNFVDGSINCLSNCAKFQVVSS